MVIRNIIFDGQQIRIQGHLPTAASPAQQVEFSKPRPGSPSGNGSPNQNRALRSTGPGFCGSAARFGAAITIIAAVLDVSVVRTRKELSCS